MTTGVCTVDRWCCRAQFAIQIRAVKWLLCILISLFFHRFSLLKLSFCCANCDTKRVNKNKKKSRHIDAVIASSRVHHRPTERTTTPKQTCKTHKLRGWAHRSNASTHKIDNKQHEDCVRQYLNAINNQQRWKQRKRQSAKKKPNSTTKIAPKATDSMQNQRKNNNNNTKCIQHKTRSPKITIKYKVCNKNTTAFKPAHSSHSLRATKQRC